MRVRPSASAVLRIRTMRAIRVGVELYELCRFLASAWVDVVKQGEPLAKR